MTGKIFAIGDIHGCAAKLEALLSRLPFDRARDTLVFLGDYLDRGPDARKVLDQLCRLRGDNLLQQRFGQTSTLPVPLQNDFLLPWHAPLLSL